jgi:hypothetical protein
MTPLIYILLSVLCSASHHLRSNHPEQIDACITVRGPDGYGRTGQSCVFPFIFLGVTYTACTKTTDPDDTMWCSTKTDKCDRHVTGQWGYCSEKCQSELDVVTEPDDDTEPDDQTEPDDDTVWINPITFSPTAYPTSSPTISH